MTDLHQDCIQQLQQFSELFNSYQSKVKSVSRKNNDNLFNLFIQMLCLLNEKRNQRNMLLFLSEQNEVLNQSDIDGTSLVIHDLTGKDDGEYTCELETKVLVISFTCPELLSNTQSVVFPLIIPMFFLTQSLRLASDYFHYDI